VSYDEGIPEACRRAVGELVASLDQLEILLLLHRGRARTFAVADVALAVGTTEANATRELERLTRLGLVAREDDRHRLAAEGERAAQVEAIARCYGENRIGLINHVASQALQRIRELADAFRLGKGKKDG
jgi:DNA-binding MarR family transcriptional regulator